MPRNYQRKRNNPYWLPHNVYMQVLYIVRDYDRMKSEQEDVIYSSGNVRGPKNKPGDPTANKAEMLIRMSEKTDAVEAALESIPEEYRKGVWHSMAYTVPYPIYADLDTWKRWKSRFAYYIAKKLKYI